MVRTKRTTTTTTTTTYYIYAKSSNKWISLCNNKYSVACFIHFETINTGIPSALQIRIDTQRMDLEIWLARTHRRTENGNGNVSKQALKCGQWVLWALKRWKWMKNVYSNECSRGWQFIFAFSSNRTISASNGIPCAHIRIQAYVFNAYFWNCSKSKENARQFMNDGILVIRTCIS